MASGFGQEAGFPRTGAEQHDSRDGRRSETQLLGRLRSEIGPCEWDERAWE